MTELLLTSHSPQATARYAEIVAAELRPRDVLLLAGDLGDADEGLERLE